MKNSVLKIIIGILTIISGGGHLISNIFLFTYDVKDLALLINLALIILGLVLLITKERPTAKAMVIGILIAYGASILLSAVVSLVTVFRVSLSLGINILPIIFAIIYLTNESKEAAVEPTFTSHSDDIHHKMTGQPTASEERLNVLRKLYDDGLISYDEYHQKRQQIIDKL